MANPKIQQYYADAIQALIPKKPYYYFDKHYAQDDELILVEFGLVQLDTGEVTNISLHDLVVDIIAGLDDSCSHHQVTFNLYHAKVATQFKREGKSVSRCKILHAWGGDAPDEIFNMTVDEEHEDNYTWRYTPEDNIIHTATDLAYMLITFRSGPEFFPVELGWVHDLFIALEQWCPEFAQYKDDIINATFK